MAIARLVGAAPTGLITDLIGVFIVDTLMLPPETFSLPLSEGNKLSVSFRRLPVTTQDWKRIHQYLKMIQESMTSLPTQANTGISEPPPAPMGNVGRIFRGHIPSEEQLAKAAERIGLRDTIRQANFATAARVRPSEDDKQ